MTVAVLGTGIMGAPMARHLCESGLAVRVWNRSLAKAEPLAAAGAVVSATPAEAVQGAEFVLTMLYDADAVVAVMTEGSAAALPALAPGAVWIQASTVGVDGCARLAGLAAEHGVPFVDAPVLGTRAPAERGALTVLAAGPGQVRERVQPLFDAYAAKTVWLGEQPGQASRFKLVANSWVLALTTATAEAIALAEAFGIDGARFLDGIKGGPLDSAYAQLKGGMMLAGEFPPSFPLSGAAKDARLIVEAGRGVGVEMAVTEAVRREMERVVEAGFADEDMAAVIRAHRRR